MPSELARMNLLDFQFDIMVTNEALKEQEKQNSKQQSKRRR